MLCSEFCIFYLDDATLGGNEADVCDDFKMIEREAAAVGLELNHHKSELICADQAGLALLHLAPDLCSPAQSQHCYLAGLTNWIVH